MAVPTDEASLAHWFDPTDPAYLGGADVDESIVGWDARFGGKSLEQASSGNRPTRSVMGVNNLSAVRCNGTDGATRQFMDSSTTMGLAVPYTIIIAVTEHDDKSDYAVFQNQGGTDDMRLNVTAGTIRQNWGPEINTGVGFVTGAPTIITMFSNTAATGVRINGTQQGSTATINEAFDGNLRIGWHEFASTSFSAPMLFGDLIFYSSILSGEALLGQEAFVASRWQLPFPSGDYGAARSSSKSAAQPAARPAAA